MNYRQHLLDVLLDKYENSAHFHGNAQVNRRVALPFTKNSLPVYFAGDLPREKAAIHQAVAELQASGLLTVEWLPGEKGNLIKRIALNLDALPEAYHLTARTPKADQLDIFAEMIRQTLAVIPAGWMHDVLTDTLHSLQNSRNLPFPFPAEAAALRLLLQALAGLADKGEAEIPERIFSIRYLGHSKHFAGKTRGALISLARSRLLPDPDLSDEDILAELGLVRTSAEILLAGPLVLAMDDTAVDLSPLTFGAVIDSHQAARAHIIALQTSQILLVENKTIFHELIRQNVTRRMLLIYLGGFPGPAKRRFLQSLNMHAQQSGAAVWHWGDIDYGGFRIFSVLQEQVFPHIRPLFMDEATLLHCREMAEPLQASYRQKLVSLQQDARFGPFHAVIALMLAENIRLEQEAVLAAPGFSIPM